MENLKRLQHSLRCLLYIFRSFNSPRISSLWPFQLTERIQNAPDQCCESSEFMPDSRSVQCFDSWLPIMHLTVGTEKFLWTDKVFRAKMSLQKMQTSFHLGILFKDQQLCLGYKCLALTNSRSTLESLT